MESLIDIHIEKLPEGFYLATAPHLPGLIAQGRTVAETLEIARDVARKLIEARQEREGDTMTLPAVKESFDYSLVVGY
jgi:predicted RNase H-like HicB family nuclease